MDKEAEEIIQILREELAANKIDKSDFSLKLSRRAVGKIKRRLERLEAKNAVAGSPRLP